MPVFSLTLQSSLLPNTSFNRGFQGSSHSLQLYTTMLVPRGIFHGNNNGDNHGGHHLNHTCPTPNELGPRMTRIILLCQISLTAFPNLSDHSNCFEYDLPSRCSNCCWSDDGFRLHRLLRLNHGPRSSLLSSYGTKTVGFHVPARNVLLEQTQMLTRRS